MTAEHVLDVAISPEGALRRISGAINRRPKRALGVFKVENEYVGYVTDERFEIWERRQQAVHARGRAHPKRGGTRIEVCLVVTRRTWALIVVFFGLYAVVAVGIATRPPETFVSLEELGVAVAGAAVLALIFAAAALRQRANLRAFVERVFGDVPRI